MPTKFLVMLPLLLSLLVSLNALAIEFRQGENLNIEGTFKENLFVAGSEIEAKVESSDDLYFAGGEISFQGRTDGHLFMAGGDLTLGKVSTEMGILAGGNLVLEDFESQELILAGGNIELKNNFIHDDVVVAGGRIFLDNQTEIQGSAILAGGKIIVNGVINEELVIRGRKVTLAGKFLKDVHVEAEKLEIASHTFIGGDLRHSVNKLGLSPGSRVQGKIVKVEPYETAFPKNAKKVWKGLFGLGSFLLFLGILILAPFLVILLPQIMDKGVQQWRTNFWECLGKGVVIILLLPLIFLILFISIIGIPFGILGIASVTIIFFLVFSLTAYGIGRQMRKIFQKRKSREAEASLTETTETTETTFKGPSLSRKERFGWTLLGSFLMMISLGIPYLGFLLWIIFFWSGIGALFIQFRSMDLNP